MKNLKFLGKIFVCYKFVFTCEGSENFPDPSGELATMVRVPAYEGFSEFTLGYNFEERPEQDIVGIDYNNNNDCYNDDH